VFVHVYLYRTSEGSALRRLASGVPVLATAPDDETRDAVILDRDDYVRLLSHDDRLRLGAR